ncbi:MAG: PE-PGRS family protein, partial [Rhodocyclaceae bacterium]
TGVMTGIGAITSDGLISTSGGLTVSAGDIALTDSTGTTWSITSAGVASFGTSVTIAGTADGTDALILTLGDILVTNGDVDIAGGDFNVTLDDQDVFNLVGTAASSVAGNGAAAANVFTITGPAGQASSGSTGQTGGVGSAASLTGGAGGAVAGASGIGGAGGAFTFAAGAGGAGAATGGVGGAVSITAGAAGTGGNAAGGTLTLNSGAVTGTGTSTLNIGTASTTIINLGDSTVTKTIDIGGVTSSDATTLNIATEGTAADVIAIGNTNAATTIAITGGDDWSMSAAGVLTMSASAAATTAIVITDTDYTNALSVGDNTITGTTWNLGAGTALTLGDALTGTNAATVAIFSSDWEISTTGVMTGIGAITSDG